MPPLRPMLAKATDTFPSGDWIFEPKWDGFRCIVFRDGDEIELGSRNDKGLTRYFPELLDPLRAQLPPRCVVDGELVVMSAGELDFDLLGQRIHPAESRINRLATETPASFIAFDLIALEDQDIRGLHFADRRKLLEVALGNAEPPLLLCPATTDRSVAQDWFERFEGAGLDGVMAKQPDGTYEPNKRAQVKIKHRHTADVVVAGYRPHKDGKGVGSLLLGVYDDDAVLHHIGVASSFPVARRVELEAELASHIATTNDQHPWAEWSNALAHEGSRMPGAPSRWGGGKDHSWIPLRIELVAEVSFEQVTHGRLRHPARFVRWRPDKSPQECNYDQLSGPTSVDVARLFG